MTVRPSFPNTLKFVREKRRLSTEQVAFELGTTTNKLEKIERGEAIPTLKQFRELQAIYGLPDYQLAGDTEPVVPPVVVDLRQERIGPLRLSPKGLKAYFGKVQIANAIDGIAESLQLGQPKPVPPGFSVNNIALRAPVVHGLLKFDPTSKRWIDAPDLALRYLRAKIEEFGVYCFFADAPPSDFRGLFSRLSDRASLIIINKKTFSDKARLFTLMHEFAHYLVGLEGASDPLVTNNSTEQACNIFASKFLAPDALVSQALEKAQDSPAAARIRRVSDQSLLSFGAVAYRLHEDGKITDVEYQSWFAANRISGDAGSTEPQSDDAEGESSGGNWAYNVVTDLGFRPLQFIEKAVRQGAIDDVAAGQIINARHGTQELAFETVSKRLAALGL